MAIQGFNVCFELLRHNLNEHFQLMRDTHTLSPYTYTYLHTFICVCIDVLCGSRSADIWKLTG